MANFNRVLLMGNLTRDPELKFLPSGSQVAEFGMAVNRRWNDAQSGETREQVCFVEIVAYGRQAETIHKYLKKGRPVFIEGRLDYSSWETPEGQKRSKLRVVVENFQFVDAAPGQREGGGEGDGAPAARGARNYRAATGGAPAPAANVTMDDEDIPF